VCELEPGTLNESITHLKVEGYFMLKGMGKGCAVRFRDGSAANTLGETEQSCAGRSCYGQMFVLSRVPPVFSRNGFSLSKINRGCTLSLGSGIRRFGCGGLDARSSAWCGQPRCFVHTPSFPRVLRGEKKQRSIGAQGSRRTVMVALTSKPVPWKRLAGWFVDGFPVWCMLASYLALRYPQVFISAPFVTSPQGVTFGLSLIMLSMGMTLTWQDVGRCLGLQPPAMEAGTPSGTLATSSMVRRAVLVNTIMCFVVMPLVAYLLAKTVMTSTAVVSSLLGASPDTVKAVPGGMDAASKALKSAILTGMVLLGSVSGGQASNLCTYIAKGDVGMSVTMTTATTLLVTVALPLITSLLLGAAVPVDGARLATSTARVVLLPLALGIALNTYVLRTNEARSRLAPWLPVLGVAATLFTIVGALSPVSATVLAALSETPLVLAVAGFHIFGGFLGYYISKRMPGFYGDEATARTISIETMFKSPALSFILAAKHFDGAWVLVPSSISLVVLAPIAAAYAVLLRRSASLSFPAFMAGASSLTPFRNLKQVSLGSAAPSPQPVVRSNVLTVGETRVKSQPPTALPIVTAPGRLLHPRVRVYFRNAPNPVIVPKSELRNFLLKMRKMKGMQVVKIVEV
jgi:BASS family bile acid:Na+ symporter